MSANVEFVPLIKPHKVWRSWTSEIITSSHGVIPSSAESVIPVSNNPSVEEAAQKLYADLLNFLQTGNYVAKDGNINTKNLFSYTKVGGDPEFFIETRSKKPVKVPSYEWFKTDPESHSNFGIDVDTQPIKKVELFNSQFWPMGFQRADKPLNIRDTKSMWFNPFVHPDGFQIEMGYWPVACMESTANYIKLGISDLNEALHDDHLTISKDTSYILSEEEAKKIPLGCRPSYNAHSIDNNITMKNPLARFTGGHFHFSSIAQARGEINPLMTSQGPSADKLTIEDPGEVSLFNSIYNLKNLTDQQRQLYIDPIIRAMDATAGILSVAMAGEIDNPERRKHHYGMAGDYRITDNTIEYRVPSNAMWFSPVSWHIIGMWGRAAMRAYLSQHHNGAAFRQYIDRIKDWGTIIDIINNTDYNEARKYIQLNYQEMATAVHSVESYLSEAKAVNKVQHIAASGIKNTISRPTATIHHQWNASYAPQSLINYTI